MICLYSVGRRETFVRGLGTFANSKIGHCVDTSMDKFAVSPRAVRVAIRAKLKEHHVDVDLSNDE
jgi:hypothetical protein